MSFPAYPAYKESRVEWIGKIPVGWTVSALKNIVSMKSGEQITAEQIEETGDYPVYGGNGLRGYTDSFTHSGYYPLIGRQGALCGNINYARGKFWASEHAVVVSPKTPCSVVWLGELLRAMNLGQYSITAAQPGLSVEVVGNLRIPIPPSPEQSAIAAFLDRETAKIDALVAEQERLMALLKEKRQAVISQAVTKGLNPNAKMKDSGVEWLGEIPAHWAVETARRLFDERDERSPTGEETLLTVSHLTGVTPRSEKTVYMFEAETTEGYKLCQPGDLVINTLWAWMGAMGVAHVEGIVSPAYNVYTPRARFNSEYVNALVRMPVFAQEAERYSKGVWASRLRLYPEEFFRISLPIPPVEEQVAIAQHVSAEASRMGALVTESERVITLLKERRAALISAAVTGKIDVRGLVPQAQAAA